MAKKKKPVSPSEVKASDIMQKDVLSLRADATVDEAIGLLEEYHVSGAPVLDGGGQLIGVLSATDIARREHVAEGRIGSRSEYFMANPLEEEAESWSWEEDEQFLHEDYNPETLGQARVRDWMNPSIVSVQEEASLTEVCRLMVQENIHRVLVVEDGTLKGIISTFDVVRYLATA